MSPRAATGGPVPLALAPARASFLFRLAPHKVTYEFTHKMSKAEAARFPKKVDTVLIQYATVGNS